MYEYEKPTQKKKKETHTHNMKLFTQPSLLIHENRNQSILQRYKEVEDQNDSIKYNMSNDFKIAVDTKDNAHEFFVDKELKGWEDVNACPFKRTEFSLVRNGEKKINGKDYDQIVARWNDSNGEVKGEDVKLTPDCGECCGLVIGDRPAISYNGLTIKDKDDNPANIKKRLINNYLGIQRILEKDALNVAKIKKAVIVEADTKMKSIDDTYAKKEEELENFRRTFTPKEFEQKFHV